MRPVVRSILGVLVSMMVFCTSCQKPKPNTISPAAADRYPVKIGGKWGYMDTSGKLAIQPQFDEAGFFSEGLADVCVGRCGFTETSHEWEGREFKIKGGRGSLLRSLSSVRPTHSTRTPGSRLFAWGSAPTMTKKKSLALWTDPESLSSTLSLMTWGRSSVVWRKFPWGTTRRQESDTSTAPGTSYGILRIEGHTPRLASK